MAGVAAVIVAAGRGSRAGGDLPKQFRPIGGAPMIRQSLVMFVEHPEVGLVQPVIHPDDVAMFALLGGRARRSAAGIRRRHAARPRCAPGSRRWHPHEPDIVLVHDAARPFASAALVSRAIAAAARERRRDPGAAGHRHGQDRRCGKAASTGRSTATRCAWCRRRKASPSPLCSTRIAARRPPGREDFTDDAALAEWAGLKVSVFAGEPGNIKITNAGGFRARRSDAICRAWRRAHRHRHRRARLRPRRSRHARRRAHPA